MDFPALLKKFVTAVEGGDAEGFARLFTEDAVYVDGFYGPFEGRAAIAKMISGHFHGTGKDYRWIMRDPVYAGDLGYARYVFRYTSTLPEAEGRQVVFEGISQFRFRDGKIERYSEVFDRGAALSQLDFVPERRPKERRKRARGKRTTTVLSKNWPHGGHRPEEQPQTQGCNL